MLLGPIIGQQHEDPNVRVSLETRLQQPVADSPALTCLGDEDVLEVDDGHVVRQTAREADQSLILARGDDKRRVAHGLDEAIQIARVCLPPDRFVERRELVGTGAVREVNRWIAHGVSLCRDAAHRSREVRR